MYPVPTLDATGKCPRWVKPEGKARVGDVRFEPPQPHREARPDMFAKFHVRHRNLADRKRHPLRRPLPLARFAVCSDGTRISLIWIRVGQQPGHIRTGH